MGRKHVVRNCETKMEKLETNHGKVKILYEGHLYNKRKQLANGFTSYECEKRVKSKNSLDKCRARIRVRGEEVVKSDIQHTHAPDPARAELLKVKSGNKRRAVDTLETPQQILGAAVGGLTEGNEKLLHVFVIFLVQM